MVIGIDVGLTGGIAELPENQGAPPTRWWPMPVIDKVLDLNALYQLFADLRFDAIQSEPPRIHAYLEKASARPDQGTVSMFKFGRVFGALVALLVASAIPYTLVHPATWSKVIHAGIGGDVKDTKQKSLIAVKMLFPGLDLRASDRCKVPHSGIVDAIAIAEYGRRTRRA
jgi:hypothetical protein